MSSARHLAAAALAVAWLATGGFAAEPASTPPAAEVAARTPTPADFVPRVATSLLEELDLEAIWLENTKGDWAMLAAAILAGLVAGRLAAWTLRYVAGRLERRGWRLRGLLFDALANPLSLALLTVALTFGLGGLKMTSAAHTLQLKTLLLLYSVSGFWYIYNLIGACDLLLLRFGRKKDTLLDQQLVPIIRKGLRLLLLVVATLCLVESVFERDIGAWLAGLGIVGIALSLAAQDSLKNFFGSLTLILDRPFRVGERIIYSGYDGVIEEMGFRSTKLRTLAGHLVTIPNLNIVNGSVENVSRRPAIRRVIQLTLVRGTAAAKIEDALGRLRAVFERPELREPVFAEIEGQPRPPQVVFLEFVPDGFSLSITYWYAPPDYDAFAAHAERLNLAICAELAAAGVALAQPVAIAAPLPPRAVV